MNGDNSIRSHHSQTQTPSKYPTKHTANQWPMYIAAKILEIRNSKIEIKIDIITDAQKVSYS